MWRQLPIASKIKIFQCCLKIIDGKGDQPVVEIFCGDMVKVGGNFLLNQGFEAADVFVLQNFDTEGPLGVVTENKESDIS